MYLELIAPAQRAVAPDTVNAPSIPGIMLPKENCRIARDLNIPVWVLKEEQITFSGVPTARDGALSRTEGVQIPPSAPICFLLLDEGRVPLILFLSVGFVGGCFFVSASEVGC